MRTVLLGDSHLARVRRELPRLGPVVVNAAVGGASSGDLAAQSQGASVGPGDVAVVSIGTNDAAPWKVTGLEDFVADLRGLVGRASPHRWIHVATPGVDEARLGRSSDRTNEVMSQYREAASAVFADARGLVLSTHDLIRALGGRAFTDDGVHLSAAGYGVLLPALRRLLDQAGHEDPEPPDRGAPPPPT